MSDLRETIVAAALRLGELTISALPPARHHTLLHALQAVQPEHRVAAHDQGFLTSNGRYVSRDEALQIAVSAEQIAGPKFQPHHLFSEDLW